jgi:hypothetical protein
MVVFGLASPQTKKAAFKPLKKLDPTRHITLATKTPKNSFKTRLNGIERTNPQVIGLRPQEDPLKPFCR